MSNPYNNPLRYEDEFFKVGNKMSPENAKRLQQTDPIRVKYLTALVKDRRIQLGGRKTRKTSLNKNKKKYNRSSQRRHGK